VVHLIAEMIYPYSGFAALPPIWGGAGCVDLAMFDADFFSGCGSMRF
jgi:hypothetical protein